MLSKHLCQPWGRLDLPGSPAIQGAPQHCPEVNSFQQSLEQAGSVSTQPLCLSPTPGDSAGQYNTPGGGGGWTLSRSSQKRCESILARRKSHAVWPPATFRSMLTPLLMFLPGKRSPPGTLFSDLFVWIRHVPINPSPSSLPWCLCTTRKTIFPSKNK